MEEQKPNRRDYTVGYKKLKNVDLFEEFDAAGAVSENIGRFAVDIDSLYNRINILQSLQDEGYMDGPYLKDGVTIDDINDLTDNNANSLLDADDLFATPEDVHTWCMDLLADMGEMSKKYLAEFK